MSAQREPGPRGPDGRFERAADFLSQAIGTPPVFMLALAVVLGWAIVGPFAGFSTTWQLFINSFTTIATFLMVFLLANASNRLTENQDAVLAGIYGEERALETEETLVLQRLEEQDRKLEEILAALRANGD